MKNELQIFKSDEFGQVRTVLISNEPYFVGKDVTEILGYERTTKAVVDHVDEEDRQMIDGTTQSQIGIELGQRGGWIINESGLYSLILSSKLPAAKKFKRWVTSEVLPSIRKHGAYMTAETIEDVLLHPDTLIKLAQNLKEEQEKRKAAEAQVEADRPKVVFADSVSVSKTSILIGDLAKILKQNNIDMGQKRLFHWLRENSYLIKRKGAEYNSPTQRAMEKGLFEIKETVITHADGHTSISKTTKVTGKGQIYFVNKFLAEKGGGGMMGKTSKKSKKGPILTPEVMEKVVEVFMEYFEEAPGLYLKPLAAVYACGDGSIDNAGKWVSG